MERRGLFIRNESVFHCCSRRACIDTGSLLRGLLRTPLLDRITLERVAGMDDRGEEAAAPDAPRGVYRPGAVAGRRLFQWAGLNGGTWVE
jgi:hypothetical protein|mmetsp:Transcript_66664/g.148791  ORF Transcript_66664/g.148791 Transcript_66664/m.148791 type:complete len:90 (+) Transcript_66664:958-1227(+)